MYITIWCFCLNFYPCLSFLSVLFHLPVATGNFFFSIKIIAPSNSTSKMCTVVGTATKGVVDVVVGFFNQG